MQTDDLKNTYNKIAADYAKDHEKDTWDDDFIELFSQALFPKAKVLDLGCGPGTETARLFKKGFTLYGFDLSPELLSIAAARTPEAIFTQGNMIDTLPYEDNFFDGIFAKASLLHIPKSEMGKVLAEVTRILKKGGIFHIAVKQGEG